MVLDVRGVMFIYVQCHWEVVEDGAFYLYLFLLLAAVAQNFVDFSS